MPAYFIALFLQFFAIVTLGIYFFLSKKDDGQKPIKHPQDLPSSSKLAKIFKNEEEKLVTESRLYTEEAEASFEKEISQFRNAIQQGFEKELRSALADFNLFLQELENEGKTSQKAIEEKIISQTTQSIKENQEKAQSLIEKELTGAKQAAQSYKEAKMKIIDEHIVAILTDTLKGFLAKKLTPADHVDAVYESLEEAKKDKFISV